MYYTCTCTCIEHVHVLYMYMFTFFMVKNYFFTGNGFDDKAAEPLSKTIKVCYCYSMREPLLIIMILSSNYYYYYSLCMQTSRRVTFLDLSHNMLSEAAGVILGPALGINEILFS